MNFYFPAELIDHLGCLIHLKRISSLFSRSLEAPVRDTDHSNTVSQDKLWDSCIQVGDTSRSVQVGCGLGIKHQLPLSQGIYVRPLNIFLFYDKRRNTDSAIEITFSLPQQNNSHLFELWKHILKHSKSYFQTWALPKNSKDAVQIDESCIHSL